ncbi:hypothetical protein [Bacillus albus]|uniref:hypothetical protein n=1 Tax=Bacillus albus TaxID=2026189 RepID=UPI001F5D15D5|nr:hypothetical protein [Bacillus albus]
MLNIEEGIKELLVYDTSMEVKDEQVFAELISLQQRKKEKEIKKLTSEQKFKLLAMKVICSISKEDLEGIFERGLSIDQLFTGVANRYYKNEKAIRR